MLEHRSIHQPSQALSHGQELANLVGEAGIERVDLAMAYVTNNGVSALERRISAHPAARRQWGVVPVRWLVGIDWLRSEPIALDRLAGMTNATVRVHDGRRVVARTGCWPYVPWHPKVALGWGTSVRAMLHGSANLSHNGLERGHEVGSLQVVRSPKSVSEHAIWGSVDSSFTWFENEWTMSAPYESLRRRFRERFDAEVVKRGAPTEDDASLSASLGRKGGMSPEKISALRASNNLWIHAGNLHKNRGPNKPGDQLMMTAMTRVFFGVAPEDCPKDTSLGSISVRHPANGLVVERPLRFSNNSMDVLTLPVPESPWPPAYDQRVLLFTKIAVGRELHFELRVGNASEVRLWQSKSRRLGTEYAMTSGRGWGVF